MTKSIKLLKLFLGTYAATYLLLILANLVMKPGFCEAGQEIEEGCSMAFPAAYTFWAAVNIPLSIIVFIVLLIAIGIYKLIEKK